MTLGKLKSAINLLEIDHPELDDETEVLISYEEDCNLIVEDILSLDFKLYDRGAKLHFNSYIEE